ncbi:hypothetical protein JHW43_005928 [Diplocarpon mali]|nr:hypothetical protein JHW43_005928 [Diplocarpon mali]
MLRQDQSLALAPEQQYIYRVPVASEPTLASPSPSCHTQIWPLRASQLFSALRLGSRRSSRNAPGQSRSQEASSRGLPSPSGLRLRGQGRVPGSLGPGTFSPRLAELFAISGGDALCDWAVGMAGWNQMGWRCAVLRLASDASQGRILSRSMKRHSGLWQRRHRAPHELTGLAIMARGALAGTTEGYTCLWPSHPSTGEIESRLSGVSSEQRSISMSGRALTSCPVPTQSMEKGLRWLATLGPVGVAIVAGDAGDMFFIRCSDEGPGKTSPERRLSVSPALRIRNRDRAVSVHLTCLRWEKAWSEPSTGREPDVDPLRSFSRGGSAGSWGKQHAGMGSKAAGRAAAAAARTPTRGESRGPEGPPALEHLDPGDLHMGAGQATWRPGRSCCCRSLAPGEMIAKRPAAADMLPRGGGEGAPATCACSEACLAQIPGQVRCCAQKQSLAGQVDSHTLPGLDPRGSSSAVFHWQSTDPDPISDITTSLPHITPHVSSIRGAARAPTQLSPAPVPLASLTRYLRPSLSRSSLSERRNDRSRAAEPLRTGSRLDDDLSRDTLPIDQRSRHPGRALGTRDPALPSSFETVSGEEERDRERESTSLHDVRRGSRSQLGLHELGGRALPASEAARSSVRFGGGRQPPRLCVLGRGGEPSARAEQCDRNPFPLLPLPFPLSSVVP